MRFIASVCATIFLLTVPVAATAQAAATRATRSAPPSPFELVLGQSTLQEAEAKWAANGVVITNRGQAAIGAGSGVDGMSTLPAERIVLVDVDAAPLEGSRPARFVFFDGVLYSIQTVLRPLLQPKGRNVQSLTEQEVLELEKQMRQRYGAPNQALRDMTAGKKPNIFVWNFEQNTLTLAIGTLAGSTLSYTNPALAKKADAYKDKVCRSIRACGGGR